MDDPYVKLAKILDTLPNGFPSTEEGVELKILKKIFTPEEAELFGRLKLSFETVEQISQRTGLPLKGLEERLFTMAEKGQLMAIDFGEIRVFRMMPYVFGIYEFQLPHMDREFAEMAEEYSQAYGEQFYANTPQMMYTLPIEEEIATNQEALSYDRVSAIVEQSESIMVQECICKKEQALLDNPCQKPTEVCMAFAPVPNVFEGRDSGRVLTKAEALELLKQAEEAGLVHMTNNFLNGRFFICNCCGCCCGVLRNITRFGIPASLVVNSRYYAVIDPDACTACGVCADERCQVKAISESGGVYAVNEKQCIGCGLCVSACPANAVTLAARPGSETLVPPADEQAWYDERARKRGVDYSKYR